ncbi:malectin domain-containing carbohydrate-binding protein [Luteolibacter arcticus]|uniref:Malectin domain-containing carbohydrate-binding protein n=1 Tax=Luteolibacter arcticus TaxID=1581411 RepID=A0ABT3GQF1_9BACT|nr:malectin domain-containing carbohydrate-binding protein [Luteolibacter arcticus]MCW1925706.1 malectin domain-containing carbohydrate-binding protein [Luteolibacter arcticus]
MSLDLDSNGNIYLVERRGAVKRHNPVTGVTTTIGTISTYSGGDFGLLGIALDPGFDPDTPASQHLYINYSVNPATATDTRLSRFTLNASGNLDLMSEKILMEVYVNRPSTYGYNGYHQSGCLRFDAAGNLWIGCGDNTDASQYSPRNAGNIMLDARKGSPNTADLRGGLLRIKPAIGGGPPEHPNYTIPAGNLFPLGTPATRPEIYTMGARNCFRFCIDPHTGWVYYGDVGPDSSVDAFGVAFGGPRAHDEFNQVRSPGWFGWPYFIGDNKPYLNGSAVPWTMSSLRSDLASYFTEPTFLNNGGVAGNPALLPDPTPAWIWYPYGAAPAQFSEFNSPNGGRCALAGAVYKYQPGNNFPAYHDRTLFLMEWSRNEIQEVKTDAAGAILEITQFAPHLNFSRPIDMVFGRDGAMYVIEWGDDAWGGASADTALVKVRYTKANLTPSAIASVDVSSGTLPLTVNFSSAGSLDPEDEAGVTFAWDFNGDQIVDSTEPNPQHIYTTAGTYSVRLSVTDTTGLVAFDTVVISAGNHAPVLSFNEPVNQGFFDWGDTVGFAFSVTDAEDGSSDAGQITKDDVLLEASLGHGDHQHTEIQANLLAGIATTPRDEGHAFDGDLAYVFDGYYTDRGAPGVEPITGNTKAVLQPKVKMAQFFDNQSGVQIGTTADAVGGGDDVISIDHGDWIMFRDFNLANIDAIRLRAASAVGGSMVKVRQDSPTGNLLASVNVGSTGSNSVYQDFTGPASGSLAGNHDLYLVFEKTAGASDLMRLNWINFRGNGVTHSSQKPAVQGVDVLGTNQFRLNFDQAVDASGLGSMSSYAINNGATISGVTPAADQRSVTLTTSGTSAGTYYTVSLSGIEDLAGDPIKPNSSVLLVTPSVPILGFACGIKCGVTGPEGLYIDGQGRVYYPDRYVVGGTPYSTTTAIANTVDDTLYRTVRHNTGSLTYAIPVPETADYEVTLKFAEIYWSANGKRVFDVKVEGAIVRSGLDIHATAGGKDIAVDLSTTVRVSDGFLTITLDNATVDNPMINAIYVERAGTFNNVPHLAFGINAGGAAYQSVIGQTPYMADAFYAPTGTVTTYTGTFTGSGGDDILYRSDRYNNGNISWQIPARNGRYQVVAQFAEAWSGASTPGVRNFNVLLENHLQQPAPLDLTAVAGYRTVYEMTRTVTVSDGTLSLTLEQNPGGNNPKINAIKITGDPTGGLTIPTGFFTWLQGYPELGMSPVGDTDHDGVDSLLEYALAGDPLVADTGILPRLLMDGTGACELSFNRPQGITDLAYDLEASGDLTSWIEITPAIFVQDLGNGTERLTYKNLPAAADAGGLNTDRKSFFRLQVGLIPPG